MIDDTLKILLIIIPIFIVCEGLLTWLMYANIDKKFRRFYPIPSLIIYNSFKASKVSKITTALMGIAYEIVYLPFTIMWFTAWILYQTGKFLRSSDDDNNAVNNGEEKIGDDTCTCVLNENKDEVGPNPDITNDVLIEENSDVKDTITIEDMTESQVNEEETLEEILEETPQQPLETSTIEDKDVEYNTDITTQEKEISTTTTDVENTEDVVKEDASNPDIVAESVEVKEDTNTDTNIVSVKPKKKRSYNRKKKTSNTTTITNESTNTQSLDAENVGDIIENNNI